MIPHYPRTHRPRRNTHCQSFGKLLTIHFTFQRFPKTWKSDLMSCIDDGGLASFFSGLESTPFVCSLFRYQIYFVFETPGRGRCGALSFSRKSKLFSCHHWVTAETAEGRAGLTYFSSVCSIWWGLPDKTIYRVKEYDTFRLQIF